MPTYSYACTSCGEQFDVVQRFTDDPLTECPACGKALRKVFHPVGVVFKGSGFYKTDSRGKSGGSTSAPKKDSADTAAASKADTAASDGSAAKSDTKSDAKSDSSPAPSTPSTGGDSAAKAAS